MQAYAQIKELCLAISLYNWCKGRVFKFNSRNFTNTKKLKKKIKFNTTVQKAALETTHWKHNQQAW